jgi:hypothetical protein
MMGSKQYDIVLEKGEATRPFFELNESERREIGLKIFLRVSKLAAQFGSQPITVSTVMTESKRLRRSIP